MRTLRQNLASRIALGPAGIFATAALVSVLAIGVERGFGIWWASRPPAHGACWIWTSGPTDFQEPIGFYLVRELELEKAPPAWISITADESYSLSLNGRHVGANRYSEDGQVDRYEVTDLLRVGRNRIVVEVRSSRGIGGMLASLVVEETDGSRRPLVVSDADWRVFHRFERAWYRAETLSGGEAPRVWERPPTGRWRLREAAVDRPPPFRLGERAHRLGPVRVRHRQLDRWIPLSQGPRQRFPRVGDQVLLDWGQPVEGFLYLDLPSDENPPALLYFGLEPPDPTEVPPDEVMIFIPGQSQWRDLHPRRFRYALLVGVRPEKKVEVRLLGSRLAQILGLPPSSGTGVFGITPPDLHSAAEELVWDRLRGRAPVS